MEREGKLMRRKNVEEMEKKKEGEILHRAETLRQFGGHCFLTPSTLTPF